MMITDAYWYQVWEAGQAVRKLPAGLPQKLGMMKTIQSLEQMCPHAPRPEAVLHAAQNLHFELDRQRYASR